MQTAPNEATYEPQLLSGLITCWQACRAWAGEAGLARLRMLAGDSLVQVRNAYVMLFRALVMFAHVLQSRLGARAVARMPHLSTCDRAIAH
jgi:hypothetical protein